MLSALRADYQAIRTHRPEPSILFRSTLSTVLVGESDTEVTTDEANVRAEATTFDRTVRTDPPQPLPPPPAAESAMLQLLRAKLTH